MHICIYVSETSNNCQRQNQHLDVVITSYRRPHLALFIINLFPLNSPVQLHLKRKLMVLFPSWVSSSLLFLFPVRVIYTSD